MRLELQTRVRGTGEMAKRYARANKAGKGKILDEVCALTGYNRSYAARLLRSGPGRQKARPARPRAHQGQG